MEQMYTVKPISNGYLIVTAEGEGTFFATANAVGKGLTEMIKLAQAASQPAASKPQIVT